MSVHDDISDTENLLVLGAVAVAVYLVYKAYTNVQAGLSWFGNAVDSAESAVSSAVSSTITDSGLNPNNAYADPNDY